MSGSGKGGFKRIGNAHLGEEQTHDNDWCSQEESVWWSKGKKGKKGLSKGKNKIPKAILAPSIKKKVQAMNYTCTKAEARIRRTCKKVPFPNQDFLLQKHQVKKDMAIPGNLTIGIPAF